MRWSNIILWEYFAFNENHVDALAIAMNVWKNVSPDILIPYPFTLHSLDIDFRVKNTMHTGEEVKGRVNRYNILLKAHHITSLDTGFNIKKVKIL